MQCHCCWLVGEKMQRSLEYYFNKPSSSASAGAVPSESSEGTNTTKPVVLRIGLRKRPVGRPMNVLFTKRRSIIVPTARGNYPVHPNSATFAIFKYFFLAR